MLNTARLLLAVAGFALLSACMPDPAWVEAGLVKPPAPKPVENAYISTSDTSFTVPAVDVEKIPSQFRRAVVYFPTDEVPGTIIINPAARNLHYVTGKNQAIRYGIAVGRDGFEWWGTALVTEKKLWPTWTPPPEMIARDPSLAKWEKGQPGGLENPLGARAIYLTTNGVDYGYRIHGTPHWESIGHNASSGCIRMINQDVMDLFERLKGGEKVVVLTPDGAYPTSLHLPPKPVVKAPAVVAPAVVTPAVVAPAATVPAAVTPAVVAPAATAPAVTTPPATGGTTTTTTTTPAKPATVTP